jgi:hypothetical protein
LTSSTLASLGDVRFFPWIPVVYRIVHGDGFIRSKVRPTTLSENACGNGYSASTCTQHGGDDIEKREGPIIVVERKNNRPASYLGRCVEIPRPTESSIVYNIHVHIGNHTSPASIKRIYTRTFTYAFESPCLHFTTRQVDYG